MLTGWPAAWSSLEHTRASRRIQHWNFAMDVGVSDALLLELTERQQLSLPRGAINPVKTGNSRIV